MEKIKEILNKLTKTQKVLIVLILVLVIILFMIFGLNKDGENSSDIYENINQVEKINTEEEEKIYIHISGEVVNPSVVELKKGARIKDAIEKAGGLTENADISKVNLAYVLDDAIQVFIPRFDKKEEKDIINSGAGDGVVTTSAIIDEDGETKVLKVNINTATIEKLKVLPGIGEETAKKIIDHRTKKGKFSKIEDLKKISGIGENKYNSLKDKITIK